MKKSIFSILLRILSIAVGFVVGFGLLGFGGMLGLCIAMAGANAHPSLNYSLLIYVGVPVCLGLFICVISSQAAWRLTQELLSRKKTPSSPDQGDGAVTGL